MQRWAFCTIATCGNGIPVGDHRAEGTFLMQLPPQRAMLRPKCWGSKGADGRAFLDDLPVQLLFRLLHSPSRFSAHRKWKRQQKRVKSSMSFLVIFMLRRVPKRPSGGMQPCHRVSGFTIATYYTVPTAPTETRHHSAKNGHCGAGAL